MFAAYYGIIVGILMLAQWGFFLAAGQVPEVQTEPIRLAFHLAAEFFTAAGLIATGFGLLKKYSWAKTGFLNFIWNGGSILRSSAPVILPSRGSGYL